jgi:hypothetical protein
VVGLQVSTSVGAITSVHGVLEGELSAHCPTREQKIGDARDDGVGLGEFTPVQWVDVWLA